MIKYLIINKYPILWIVFHLLLGISATVTPFVLIGWFYTVIFTSVALIIRKSQSPYILISLILYLISFELLSRMARTSPFIPYELSKYLLTASMIWGILKYKTFGNKGWIMLLCLVPAVLFDLSNIVQSSDLVFNVLGPINVALVAVFFYRQRVTSQQYGTMLRLMVYPILGVLSYTFIKTPDLKEIDFVLGANIDLSGGFGSNQVSTLFGLAALLLFILIVNKWKFSGNWLVDSLVLFAMCFQGLLTFSRGGMIGTVLGVLIILLSLRFASGRDKRRFQLPKIGKYVIPGILIVLVAFIVVNEITNGLLSLRYQGETMGTIQGSKVKTLNTVSTGRLDIFMGDVNLWADHFIFGVGAGASSFLRSTLTGTIAHVELSRLLAEHGLLGLVYFLILTWFGIKLFKSNPNPMYRGILLALYIVAVYTTFHAAMRTFVTPALIGLSLLSLGNKKRKIPKKTFGLRQKPQIIPISEIKIPVN